MENFKQLVISRLKTAREEVGLTQGELADLLGMARSSYTQIETGRNSLSIENLAKLPGILNKSVNYFLGIGTDDLTADEVELLDIYRSIPPGDLKENVLIYLRATAQQARGKPSREQVYEIADSMSPEKAEELVELGRELAGKEKEGKNLRGNQLAESGA